MRWKLAKSALAVAVLVGVVAGGPHLLEISNVASAFYAKTLCSGVFVSGRDADTVIAEDVLADMTWGVGKFHATIDRDRQLVTSSLFGLAERSALFREGLGCTLVNGTSVDALKVQAHGFTPVAPLSNSRKPWPAGSVVDTSNLPPGVDAQKLRAALDAAFSEPREFALRRTRAVVVVYRGRIIAERYAEGIASDMPLTGWSLGKSVASVLAGILVGEGRLDIGKTGLFDEWRSAEDPRAGISVDHLLRMTSGLDFDEPHARVLSDVRKMLFLKGDAAAYARHVGARAEPGSVWHYGSGDSVLVSSLLSRAVGGTLAEQFNFPRRVLFAPLGMASAVLEPDAAGTFLAPAFVYASARDWARFGLFLLQDGVWQGRRILPEGWLEYSLRPTEQSGGYYAAHFWRKVPGFLRPAYDQDRDLPEDRFYMLGHDGQMVAVVPSRELVVVRLGLSRRRNAWSPGELLEDILKSLSGG